eukprot:SAG31_NODE_8952_length_1357_cov_2.864865_2_plen_175_part_01
MNWSSSAWPSTVRYWGDWGCPRMKFWDYYNVSSFIHERLGMDYFMLYMPFLGVNTQSGPGCVDPPGQTGHCNSQLPHCVRANTTACHNWLRQWQAKGDRTIGYFLEPVVLTINYALNVLGYKKVYMMGLSGGGWCDRAGWASPRYARCMWQWLFCAWHEHEWRSADLRSCLSARA